MVPATYSRPRSYSRTVHSAYSVAGTSCESSVVKGGIGSRTEKSSTRTEGVDLPVAVHARPQEEPRATVVIHDGALVRRDLDLAVPVRRKHRADLRGGDEEDGVRRQPLHRPAEAEDPVLARAERATGRPPRLRMTRSVTSTRMRENMGHLQKRGVEAGETPGAHLQPRRRTPSTSELRPCDALMGRAGSYASRERPRIAREMARPSGTRGTVMVRSRRSRGRRDVPVCCETEAAPRGAGCVTVSGCCPALYQAELRPLWTAGGAPEGADGIRTHDIARDSRAAGTSSRSLVMPHANTEEETERARAPNVRSGPVGEDLRESNPRRSMLHGGCHLLAVA